MMRRGILSKDTHETVVRFAPPLVITEQEIDDALDIIGSVFASLPAPVRPAGTGVPGAQRIAA
jgi:ornithine--oxo-acid transaminase